VRWSEMGSREIINLHDGARLGFLDEADLLVEPDTGRILGLAVTVSRPLWHPFARGREVEIPWRTIKQIGPEVVIVELQPYSPRGFDMAGRLVD